MYNSDTPTRAELPRSAQLLRSTAIAIVSAAAILVVVVLPSEYGIDLTGAGRMLGLAEMGEIKSQLAEEAEADRLRDAQTVPQPVSVAPDQESSLLRRIVAEFVVGSAAAQEARSDQMSITLKPGEGAEIKLVMVKGATANYAWTANGAKVNFDTHGAAAENPFPTRKAAVWPRTKEFLKRPSTAVMAGSGATGPMPTLR